MVKISILGGGKEIGRSGFGIHEDNTTILLDYGVMLKENRPIFPLSIPPREIDGIILTHAHLDHSGALPIFYISESPRIYMKSITKELTELLIRDLLHLSSYLLPYEAIELKLMIEKAKKIKRNFRIKNIEIKTFNSGHIPGSINVLLNINNKKIWYSGDINTRETALLNKGEIPDEEVDFVIIESTYGSVDHPPREECERKLIEILNEVIEGGGRVLIPAFSVGRSQEILCILRKYNFKYPIVIDGMSRTATRIIAKWPNEVRDYKLLKKAISKAFWIKGQKDRDKVLKKPCVIISSSGMLTGGASTYYMNIMRNNEKDCVVLVSYQIPGTPGRILLDEKIYGLNKEKVKCRVEWIDFSSHCGKSELISIIKSLKGNPEVLCIHGDENSCENLANEIKQEIGLKAYAPFSGNFFEL